jgi:hypothetical protein
MSCCGHSWKLRAFTKKELETMREAQELLGAPTIGECPGRGGGGGSQRRQICLPSHPECVKTAPKHLVFRTY